MPIYEVQSPDGRTFEVQGSQPPTAEQLQRIFGQVAKPAQPRQQGLATIGDQVKAKGSALGLLGIHPGVVGMADPVSSAGIGAGKGLAGTAYNFVRGASMLVPGPDLPPKPEWLEPQGTAQKVGHAAEQIGEFFTPVGMAGKAKAALEIGKSALLTSAQGGSGGDAFTAAGLSAVVPGAGAVRAAGRKLEAAAEPLVRAAIKPTVTALRRIAGAAGEGLDAKANALVRFVIEHRLTTAEKARELFQKTEHELQRILAVRNAPTDAAVRADRYIEALAKSAGKQALGADDVALLKAEAKKLIQGPMGHDVGVDEAGNAIRALRPEVPAKEALDSARASSRWTTRKQWGEQKGASVEAAKAVERAQRDAVKAAVPEARALLQTEGKALQSADVLDRMAQRAANRDAISLPAHVVAAGEVASGNVPVLAFAANWLRNNQLKAGMWADALGKAIQAGNAPLAADILKKLGVGVVSQEMRPMPSH